MPRVSELMTMRDVAKLLGIDRATLRVWHRDGVGPPRSKLGKRFYCSREALREWIRAGFPVAASSQRPGGAAPPLPSRLSSAYPARLRGLQR